jgi:putative oxidoreductase
MREQRDFGLLILRIAGFLLVFTFGIQKIGWYWSALHAGKSFSSIGLAPLIAKMGFPISVALTRLFAASLTLGMAGALYTSVRLGEDWLRAALYLIIFVTLIFTGPGKFSLDHLLKRKKSPAGC